MYRRLTRLRLNWNGGIGCGQAVSFQGPLALVCKLKKCAELNFPSHDITHHSSTEHNFPLAPRLFAFQDYAVYLRPDLTLHKSNCHGGMRQPGPPFCIHHQIPTSCRFTEGAGATTRLSFYLKYGRLAGSNNRSTNRSKLTERCVLK